MLLDGAAYCLMNNLSLKRQIAFVWLCGVLEQEHANTGNQMTVRRGRHSQFVALVDSSARGATP